MPATPRVVLGVSAALLAVSLTACTSSKASTKTNSSTPQTSASRAPSTNASSATNTDYTSLLIGAADIPVPGVTEGTPAAPPGGTGASVAFTASGGRGLGDTIVVLPSAAAAQTAAQASVTAAKQQVTGAVATDAPIGGGGTAIRGTTSDGAVAILVFTEGKAMIVLEFTSAASDPVPTEIIQQVATAQDAKVKAGLPS
jgi:hypothetical protein